MSTHTKVTSLYEAACILRDTHIAPPLKMLEALGMTRDALCDGVLQIAKNGGTAEEIAFAGMAIGYLYAMRQLDANFGLDNDDHKQ